jgi:hypothetical protein
VGRGDATHDGTPWVAAASPELYSGYYEARRLGFTSSKWSGGQEDPYPRVLDDESGS